MNLNRDFSSDYKLKSKNINELVNLYGVECTYIFTEKMNKDFVLQDFSHLNALEAEKIFLLPENSENYESQLSWNIFGLDNQRMLYMYITKESCLKLYKDFSEKKFSEMLNSLIKFPNDEIFEITNIDQKVEGINNLFTFKENVSVYKLTLKSYYFKKENSLEIEEQDEEDIDIDLENEVMNIDEYFTALDNNSKKYDKGNSISSSDNVFGKLG